MLIFYKEETDIIAPINTNRFSFNNDQNQVCDVYQKVQAKKGGILYLWITNKGVPCRAEKTDGTTYDFTNAKLENITASVFQIPAGSNCPQLPKCGSPIDLVLVLDESGSISREDWNEIVKFSIKVVDSFIIGPNDTQIGLVYFSGSQFKDNQDPASCCGLSDPALPLSFDNTTIKNFLVNHIQSGGHTCIPCGIKAATTYEPNRNRPVQVPKVMLVLTDGVNNRMTSFFDIDIKNAKDAGWNMFAIGTFNSSLPELKAIASSEDQVFRIQDLSSLSAITSTVSYKLCGAFDNLTPCGPLCKGKCVCGGQCVCPDSCVSSSPCSVGSCTTGVAGSGCEFKKKFCPSNSTDLCNTNACNEKTGECQAVAKDCSINAPDSCYTSQCKPNVGCVYEDKCPIVQKQPGTNKPSLCYTRRCDSGSCSVANVNCTTTNKCAESSCNPSTGCTSVPINCDGKFNFFN